MEKDIAASLTLPTSVKKRSLEPPVDGEVSSYWNAEMEQTPDKIVYFFGTNANFLPPSDSLEFGFAWVHGFSGLARSRIPDGRVSTVVVGQPECILEPITCAPTADICPGSLILTGNRCLGLCPGRSTIVGLRYSGMYVRR